MTYQAVWLTIGAAAQALFAGRMLVQWWASERAGQSVVPRSFWTLSCVGGTLMLAYACWRQDPVFVVGQLGGLIVYSRNLALFRTATSPPVLN
jgi:lipid-A-disaccharide synthase-like uncharacterized protein